MTVDLPTPAGLKCQCPRQTAKQSQPPNSTTIRKIDLTRPLRFR
jgi:hypothetical protein